MIEDRAFNEFLKGRLEEDVVIPRVAVPVPAPRVFSWRRPMLMAASLAVICGVFTWQLGIYRDHSREFQLSQTIELLEDVSSVPSPAPTTSLADRLLAWQDAPFDELVE